MNMTLRCTGGWPLPCSYGSSWQVFVGGEMIGGATELHAMVETGQLEQLMTKLSGKPGAA